MFDIQRPTQSTERLTPLSCYPSTEEPISPGEQGKLAAHKATLDFIQEKHPRFPTICLHTVFVSVPSLVQTTAEDLSRTPYMLWQSLISERPAVGQVLGVHVDDAAEAHVRALAIGLENGDDGDTEGVPSYLLAAKRRSWALALLTARTMVLALQ